MNPLYPAFIAAAREAGYGETPDINGFRQEGFGRMDMTVHRGTRWSAAKAYLRPAMKRPNVAVRTKALATRIRFEGLRAVAVTYLRGGAEETVAARREIILAGGAINTPQLLKLSASGPARNCAGTASSRCGIFRASARTCKTISNSTSRWLARSRSRFIRPWVRWRRV